MEIQAKVQMKFWTDDYKPGWSHYRGGPSLNAQLLVLLSLFLLQLMCIARTR